MAVHTSEDNFVMEPREEEMTSPPMNKQSERRMAYFLRPSITSVDGPVFEPPVDSVKPTISSTPVSLKAYFIWWRKPMKQWTKWLNRMESLHRSTWKQAGIHEAIMNTTFKIHHNDNLIIGLAEKWCSKTNTFVFPWGEATITLEDMMILGGFSVLGDSVKTPLGDEGEMIVQKMLDERSRLMVGQKKKVNKPSQQAWMRRFMDSGSEIEHEAFLAYWLSKYVFPCGLPVGIDFMLETIFPITVHLARGTRIALAPAVLASLYKNLRSLKEAMVENRNLVTSAAIKECLRVDIKAPFQLVQVWAWERFPSLRPEPNTVAGVEPRLALWHELKITGLDYVTAALDQAEEEFVWRPYMISLNFLTDMVYKEEERWVSLNSGLGDKFEELARCLRTSELVSYEVDCIEQYLPHRVAMQFGMDQDLPGFVARVNWSCDIAWKNYTREVGDLVMHIPARLFNSGVTTRYMKWWKKLKLAASGMIVACDGKNSTSGGYKSIELGDDFGFTLLVNSVNTGVSGTKDKETVGENFQIEGNELFSSSAPNEADFHGHGISETSKTKLMESYSGAKDKQTLGEKFQVEGNGISSSSAHNEAEFLGHGISEMSKTTLMESYSGTKDKQTLGENFQVEGNGASSSSAQNEADIIGHGIAEMSKKKPMESFSGTKSVEDALIPPGFSPKLARVEVDEIGVKDKEIGVKLLGGESSDNRSKILELPEKMMLEERISRIEIICAWLKAGNRRVDGIKRHK